MHNLNILIADSSAVYKKMFPEAISEAYQNTSVTCVTTGEEILKIIKQRDFNLIVVDADISDNGITDILGEIKREIPRAYILVTARPSKANDEVFPEAMSHGADECMVKPIYDSYGDNFLIIKNKMTEVIRYLRAGGSKPDTETTHDESKTILGKAKKVQHKNKFHPEIVLIAASTGGPVALEQVITKLSSDFPVPILIVQHIPKHFTGNLAEILDSKSMIKVKVADNGEPISAGVVYLAPGGTHMRLDAKNKIILDDTPPINGVRPAADVLFESIAEKFKGSKILAIVLTGMGSDGKNGLKKLKSKKECFCLAQSERTCVIYGMPRTVVEEGLADFILDIEEIAPEIESFDYIPFEG